MTDERQTVLASVREGVDAVAAITSPFNEDGWAAPIALRIVPLVARRQPWRRLLRESARRP